MSTFSTQQPEHASNHVVHADLKMLHEISSDVQDWLHEALGFFSGHESYDQCKDELDGFLLSTFGVEGQQAEEEALSPTCRKLLKEYRRNDFVIGVSARLIVQYGKKKGAKLARAFQRVWRSGTSSMLI